MTNVEQSLQVLSVEQAGAFYPASKLTSFFFIFCEGGERKGGGREKQKREFEVASQDFAG